MAILLLLAAWLSAPRAWAAPADDGWKHYLAGDYAKAKAACQAPADADDASCQNLLGNLHLKGQGGKADYALAERYLRKSSEQGNSGGQQGLAYLYKEGLGVKQDLAEALRLYRLSSEQGDQWGQAGMGYLYYEGRGVKQDYAEAAKWWEKASTQGQADAQQGLAWLYYNGWGVAKDYGEAYKWAKKSADQGNQWGQNLLATLYLNGWGVKQDDAEAARLYLAAAEQGNPYASHGIGYALRTGRGVSKDYAKAMKWFRAGVEKGELSYCATNIGLMHELGEGVTQNFMEAYKWLLIGAAHDNADARAGIARLKDQMTKEQVAEAQKLAAALEAPSQASAAAAPPPAAARPPASAVDAPAFRRPERPDDVALVVGVESYSLKDLPKASFAERDADAFAAYARALGVPERNVRVLKGSDATAGKLRGYLESWLPKNVKPGARVYFYFSGHGAPNPRTGDAYLLPWDGDPALLKETAAPLAEVFASLGRLKAAQVVVALDACFSGAGGRSVIQKGTRPLVVTGAVKELPAKLSVLTAAEADETTGTLEPEGHGLFTYYLLEGLGRAKTTGEVCAYLKPKVADAAARENRTQTPTCRGPDAGF